MSSPAHQPPVSSAGHAPAPADALPHPPWPRWRKILAYAILTALALTSIWYIDRQAHQPAAPVPATSP